jgi:hypothetical protein
VATASDGGSDIVARVSAPSTGQSIELAQDPLTGIEGPASWSRIMEIENARLLRYRRPATVVMAEVEGLRLLAQRLGDEPADRLLPVIAVSARAASPHSFRRRTRSRQSTMSSGSGSCANRGSHRRPCHSDWPSVGRAPAPRQTSSSRSSVQRSGCIPTDGCPASPSSHHAWRRPASCRCLRRAPALQAPPSRCRRWSRRSHLPKQVEMATGWGQLLPLRAHVTPRQ